MSPDLAPSISQRHASKQPGFQEAAPPIEGLHSMVPSHPNPTQICFERAWHQIISFTLASCDGGGAADSSQKQLDSEADH